jgi:hypothetical protein
MALAVLAPLALTTILVAPVAVGASTVAASAHQPRASGIGIRHSFGQDSAGWGRRRPKELFNGGDPSGLISSIGWSSWGGRVASGHGKNAVFKPSGGYYGHLVTIRLRAKDPGPCGASGRIAYHHLYVSSPSRPGGKFGKWQIWTSYHRDLCKRFE